MKAKEERANEADHEVKQRLEEVEKEEEEEGEERAAWFKPFADEVSLGGFIDLNYDYTDVLDTGDANSGSSSDFYIGSIEGALRIIFNDWVKTKIVLNVEDIGKEGEDGKFNLDEAFVTLESPWAPLYLVAGKTVLPFGVFEDHLISGTLTEELYEIQRIGATLGYTPDFHGLDLSFTIYEGHDIINNLQDFHTHKYRSRRKPERRLKSFIVNASFEPVPETLLLSLYYDNEPGDGRRNQTIGASVTYNIWKFSLDGEYITALSREKGEDGEENKESAWFAALAFQLLEPLELAVRYEDFDDDRGGDQNEVLDYSCLAGFNYQIFSFATFSFEYRYHNFEKEKGSEAVGDANEFHFRLSLEF
ncbi:MAG: LbtU family siderophore porin [Deltaproteobacteria bacterium]|nr:LbtU family siderophore porin [Deltaproteobacteria bacterium]MBW2072164.1 LbtU family siderophore porin [Deltaproteobacteria bacterium]